MTLHYQLTFEDFRATLGHHFSRLLNSNRVFTILWKILKIVVSLNLVLLGLLVLLLAYIAMLRGPQALSSAMYIMWHQDAATMFAILPWYGIVGSLSIGMLLQRSYGRVWPIMLLGLGMFLVVGALLLCAAIPNLTGVRNLPRGVTAWQLSGVRNVDLWAWVGSTVYWLLTTWVVARHPIRTWRMRAELHRPITLTAGESAITVKTDVSRLEYQWDAIEKVVDRPTAILIYLSRGTYFIIPKRAFPDEETVDAFWQLIQGKGESPAKGFAVLRPSK